MASISTGAFNGNAFTPTAEREWMPRSPKAFASKSEAPLTTWGGVVTAHVTVCFANTFACGPAHSQSYAWLPREALGTVNKSSELDNALHFVQVSHVGCEGGGLTEQRVTHTHTELWLGALGDVAKRRFTPLTVLIMCVAIKREAS